MATTDLLKISRFELKENVSMQNDFYLWSKFSVLFPVLFVQNLSLSADGAVRRIAGLLFGPHSCLYFFPDLCEKTGQAALTDMVGTVRVLFV